MNSEPASPGNRGLQSGSRARGPSPGSPSARLRALQLQLNAVEKAPEPEFELLGGGSRCQLVGQLDQVRVLLGWQRAVKVAQRQALGGPKPSGAEVVHRLLHDGGQHLLGRARVDV